MLRATESNVMGPTRRVRLMVREAMAFAREGLLLPRVRPADKHHVDEPALTVFVHGYFATGGVLHPLSEHLHGTRVARSQLHFAYAPVGTIHKLASSLAEKIAARHHDGPIHLVGHSLGGLIGRYYRQVLGGRLDKLICLATPHRGTDAARSFSSLPLASEIHPESETIELLARTQLRLHGTRVCSIVANGDNLVRPLHHAKLEGHEVVSLDDVAHQSVLFDKRAWKHVARVLGETDERAVPGFDTALVQGL